MLKKFLTLLMLVSVGLMFVSINGCTFIFQKGRRSDVEKITKLKSELSELERARRELEDRLKNEIGDNQVKVQMEDRGLVITFLAEVLFDSGKATIRNEAFNTLSKVSGILNSTVRESSIGIEGHTDNVPIKHSGWKSNWELSTSRAIAVLHYLVDDQNLEPSRLAATGYGEYRPVASNDEREGRQKNRRVEIVILPKVSKTNAGVNIDSSSTSAPLAEPMSTEENLK